MKLKDLGKIKFNQDGNLVCPFCNSDYVFHTNTFVYNRKEDEEKVAYTGVYYEYNHNIIHALVNNNSSDNPSERRHGVLIRMECEECNKHFYLAINQHKGNTLLEYKADKDKKNC